jgi:hypothetical protein
MSQFRINLKKNGTREKFINFKNLFIHFRDCRTGRGLIMLNLPSSEIMDEVCEPRRIRASNYMQYLHRVDTVDGGI